jgi:alpha(1,3/1,4) fucosyltransferase
MNISFSDFWGGRFPFTNNNNFLLDLLKTIDPEINLVPLSNKTDILIYSCFGDKHLSVDRKNIKKIFFTGENKRPNFDECDYSLSFDFPDYGGKNIRLPLWYFHIDWFGKGGYGNPKYIIPIKDLDDNIFTRKEKSKFCSAMYSNPVENRVKFYKKLSEYKKVDGYGKPFNNWNYGEDNKYQIISNYKFNICFENTDYPGYHTEKLFQAKVAGCIPIYWGAETIKNDFNEKCFINLKDFNGDMDLLSEYIKEIDSDDNLYKSIFNEPLFNEPPSIVSVMEKLKNIL